jgi:hypothetical protein
MFTALAVLGLVLLGLASSIELTVTTTPASDSAITAVQHEPSPNASPEPPSRGAGSITLIGASPNAVDSRIAGLVGLAAAVSCLLALRIERGPRRIARYASWALRAPPMLLSCIPARAV